MEGEICSDTYHNLIHSLTGSDKIISIYETNNYDLTLSELMSYVLLTLTSGSLIGIHLEDIEGDISHVFIVVKLDMERYNIIQTYGGEYCKRKYTTISHVELIDMVIELHNLYTKPTDMLIRAFYSKWFYVRLKSISHPNYLSLTTI